MSSYDPPSPRDDPKATPSYSYISEMLDGIDLRLDFPDLLYSPPDALFSSLRNGHMSDHNYCASLCKVRQVRQPKGPDVFVGRAASQSPELSQQLSSSQKDLDGCFLADAAPLYEADLGFNDCEEGSASPTYDQVEFESNDASSPMKVDVAPSPVAEEDQGVVQLRKKEDDPDDDSSFPDEQQPSTSQAAESQFICSICSKPFNRSSNKKRHELSCQKKRVNQQPTEKYCSICGKSFRSQGHLKRHLMHHVKIKPHECDICLKAFTQKDHLKRHLATHLDESAKTNKCAQCGKGFLSRWELRRHEAAAHPTAWKFQCGWCESKGFKSWRAYEAHTSWHIEEQGYFCQECETAFKHSWDLDNHMATHSRQPQFACAKCSATFIQRIQLDRHIWKVHAVQPSQSSAPETCKSTKDDSSLPSQPTSPSDGPLNVGTVPGRIGPKAPLPRVKGNANSSRSSRSASFKKGDRRISAPVLKCTECEQDFPRNQLAWYLRHVRIVHGFTEQPVICTYCGRFYRSKRHYQEHTAAEHYVRLKPFKK